MMEAMLQVLSPGIGCRIISSPLQGFRDIGVVSGGAIDTWSAQKANLLVGNDNFYPCLEIPYGPIKFLTKRSCLVAIVGYGFRLKINGESQPLNHSLLLENGDKVELLSTQNSGTSYLAICGGIKPLLNDSSAYSLEKNDFLFQNRKTIIKPSLSSKGVRLELLDTRLHVLPGPEIDIVERDIIASFFNSPWRIDRAGNRMGIRLFSTHSASSAKPMPSLRSHAVVPGTLQMSSANSCIALMADCQTTGGYPRIASIIEADIWKLAQLTVNTEISFSVCSSDNAQHELLKKTHEINRLSYASNHQKNLRQ